jgi:hypothetical protein
MKVLRWIALLPAAFLAGVLVVMILTVLAGPANERDDSTRALAGAGVAMAGGTLAALFVAWKVAPAHKPWVVIVLALILIVLNALELWSVLNAQIAAKDRIRVAEVIGFVAVAGAALVYALRFRRRTSPAHHSPG